jgi:hypothetical protein
MHPSSRPDLMLTASVSQNIVEQLLIDQSNSKKATVALLHAVPRERSSACVYQPTSVLKHFCGQGIFTRQIPADHLHFISISYSQVSACLIAYGCALNAHTHIYCTGCDLIHGQFQSHTSLKLDDGNKNNMFGYPCPGNIRLSFQRY